MERRTCTRTRGYHFPRLLWSVRQITLPAAVPPAARHHWLAAHRYQCPLAAQKRRRLIYASPKSMHEKSQGSISSPPNTASPVCSLI